MKESKQGEFILTLVFLAFFVGLIAISMTYSPNARRMPLTVMIPGALLCVVVLVKQVRSMKAPAEEGQEDKPADEKASGAGSSAKTRKMFVMFGWMILLVGMIWTVGFLVTIPVYTILFMRSLKESWRLSLIFGVVGFIVLYYLFVVGLSMELYPGIIYQIWMGYA